MAKAHSNPGGGGKEYTTQRVDLNTLSNIKTLNYHLMKSGVRMNQCEVIEHAIQFSLSRESEFIEYVSSERVEQKESAFDTLVRISGKPWFPYGNLVELK